MALLEFEWLLIDEYEEEEPTKAEIAQAIQEKGWTAFDRERKPFILEESVAIELLTRHFWEWEVETEDEYVFIAVKEKGATRYSVFRTILAYAVAPYTDEIYFEEDE